MSISLQALEAALSEIEELGHDETKFEVGNTTLTLRTLTPEQEFEVQRYASQAWSDNDDNDSGETLAFIDRFRVRTIAMSIVAVGDQDLRNVEYVETGEVTGDGVPIKEPRHKAMMKLVSKWGGPIRAMIFKKYTELLRKVEARAEKLVIFEPSDTEAEIDRLKTRIEELEQENRPEPEHPAHVVARVGDLDIEDRKGALREPEEPRVIKPHETDVEPSPVLGPSHTVQRESRGTRRPITPQEAPAPPKTSPEKEQPTPAPTSPPSTPEGGILTMDGGSFVGEEDLSTAVAEANQQLAEARLKAGQPSYPPAESALMAAHAMGRIPPHMNASAAAAEIAEAEMRRQVQLRGKTSDGTEVFAFPSEPVDLDSRVKNRPSPPAPSSPKRGTQNPRFRRPQRG